LTPVVNGEVIGCAGNCETGSRATAHWRPLVALDCVTASGCCCSCVVSGSLLLLGLSWSNRVAGAGIVSLWLLLGVVGLGSSIGISRCLSGVAGSGVVRWLLGSIAGSRVV
jgi:hypothetical protein